MLVVVPIDPSRDRTPLPGLEGLLPPADRRRLYEAATTDVVGAVADSGGDLLVNYREPKDGDDGSEEAARNALADADLAEARFERQVGSTRSARTGNTVTHLLREEGETSVGVLEPTAALVSRTEVDGVAMKIRRNGAVLGPAPDGAVYLAAFGEPIDFADAYTDPELSTIARKAADAGLEIGFAPMVPTIETEAGLRSTVAGLKARRAAGRPVPEATAAAVDDLGLATDNAF
ncbi:hypothetical protein [Saliphagus sp. LR7]|uniref:hypothetical protein n=1 Tax=Saliphagus sp. LR7 TaxID=2282654 RepID=UPI000DF73E3B|nr:hypothetical protein [Saliphagus sp. LR7]